MQLLVSVGIDDSHTIVVWDWASGTMLSSAKGHNDLVCACLTHVAANHTVCQVFDVQFSTTDPNAFSSCGVKHIKFWSLSGNMLIAKRGVFGQAGVVC